MTQLDEATRKRLTLFIGEEWEPYRITEWPYYSLEYGKEYSPFPIEGVEPEVRFVYQKHRSFTTVPDMLAVYRAIQKEGRWEEFWKYACAHCNEPIATPDEIASVEIKTLDDTLRKVYGRFTAWLFCLSNQAEIPERMKMVAEWMEGEG